MSSSFCRARLSVALLGMIVTVAIADVASAHGSHGRGLKGHHVEKVDFQGSKFPKSEYDNEDKPDSDCRQFPDQNYAWIAALKLGCKPKNSDHLVKIHKGDEVPGCTGEWINDDDCPKHYDGTFDTCLAILGGAVSGDNPDLYAEDGTWLTWNEESQSCYLFTNTACELLSDENKKDNSFQYCGFT
mmetsp:Transcript_205/g.690  ORF Transcript_205/g.690 Transcript_205/m.690 type:complete len:186 (-) Transcript_205:318-875(-)|eukprot:CAMPEP_0117663312 /NCGR_PEP_ID=MMETSP0804-20121206/8534_1 /TAXON_ID=1074897 /ORGANISM="Tetraselmis astigmatica, Strain CCMP880" /LENGTH=185 /DNA_ID=CAMNT_0005470299 /DNA_START=70 /DNA_END=627 /DNA_ORIENTATION=+